MRWRHPSRGMVPPDQFIPAAEASALDRADGPLGAARSLPAGQGVAGSRACRRFRLRSTSRRCSFAPPASSRTSSDSCGRRHWPPQYLELELTESALMVDSTSTTPLLELLKQFGVVLKVDDFGTGPSSLSYLQRCPVDVLKIDQSFVRDILPTPDGAPLVRAVIAMGKSLGCRVIAEGRRDPAAGCVPPGRALRRGAGLSLQPAGRRRVVRPAARRGAVRPARIDASLRRYRRRCFAALISRLVELSWRCVSLGDARSRATVVASCLPSSTPH